MKSLQSILHRRSFVTQFGGREAAVAAGRLRR